MAKNRSQVYDVDNRYSQTEGASDNDVGKNFLRQYMRRDKVARYPGVEAERKQDDRFIQAVPLANSNAYGLAGYRNQFKAEQAKNKEYTTVEDTEKTDYRTSLGELVSENIRSIYRPDSTYTENVREQYYSR